MTLVVCFIIVLLDGLDTTSISFVVPWLAREWGVPIPAFTSAFVATSLGAVVGYMACGSVAQRLGQRTAGVASVLLFGLGTLATAAAWDLGSLSLLRFISAIGLGGALPIAVAAATEAVPARFREASTMVVAGGLSAGAVMGGLLGGHLMRAYGWESIFILGGVVPLLFLPWFACLLKPASAGRVAAPPRQDAAPRAASASPVLQLFGAGLGARTGLLWGFAFLIFVANYALTFWVPTLLLEFGFEPERTALGIAAFGVGGLLGNLVMIICVAKLGIKRMLMCSTVFAMICITIASRATVPMAYVLPLVAGLGAGLVTGCIGQAALAVSLYPAHLRTAGVGWSAAMGRIGSIVGPSVGGVLLALGWSAREIILVTLLPAGLAIGLLVVLTRLDRKR